MCIQDGRALRSRSASNQHINPSSQTNTRTHHQPNRQPAGQRGAQDAERREQQIHYVPAALRARKRRKPLLLFFFIMLQRAGAAMIGADPLLDDDVLWSRWARALFTAGEQGRAQRHCLGGGEADTVGREGLLCVVCGCVVF